MGLCGDTEENICCEHRRLILLTISQTFRTPPLTGLYRFLHYRNYNLRYSNSNYTFSLAEFISYFFLLLNAMLKTLCTRTLVEQWRRRRLKGHFNVETLNPKQDYSTKKSIRAKLNVILRTSSTSSLFNISLEFVETEEET